MTPTPWGKPPKNPSPGAHRRLRRLCAAALCLAIFALSVAAATAVRRTIQADFGIGILLDGEAFTPYNANGIQVEPFAVDGTTFLPLRAIGEALGLTVTYDAENHLAVLETSEGTAGTPSAAYGDASLLALGLYREMETLCHGAVLAEDALSRAMLLTAAGQPDTARETLSPLINTTLPQLSQTLVSLEAQLDALAAQSPGAFMESVLQTGRSALPALTDALARLKDAASAIAGYIDIYQDPEQTALAQEYDQTQLQERKEATELLNSAQADLSGAYNALYQAVLDTKLTG